MGRFLSTKDISAAKYTTEVFNSALKRGDVKDANKIVREMHVVCGCGVEGCNIISCQRSEENK